MNFSYKNTIIIYSPEILSVSPRFTNKELTFYVKSNALRMEIVFTFSFSITNLCVQTKDFGEKDFKGISKETGFYRHGPYQILRNYDYSRFIRSVSKDMEEEISAFLSESKLSDKNFYDIPKLIALYVLKKIELNSYKEVLPTFPTHYNPTSVYKYYKYTGKTLTKDLVMFYAQHMEELECGKYFMRLRKETLENALFEDTLVETVSSPTNNDVFTYIFFFTSCIVFLVQFLLFIYYL